MAQDKSVKDERKHHEVFSRFRRRTGRVPAGFHVDSLGCKYRLSYVASPTQATESSQAPYPPPFDEEYFEWIDLLETVLSAKDRFVMLELGAGFGRWTARAEAACRQHGLTGQFVAVEAEPTHFEWLRQNLTENCVDLVNCRLVQAAVTSKDGKVPYHVGDPVFWGQSIGGTTEIAAVSLPTLLLPLDLVDLIDMDVQGAELEILAASIEPLTQKVRRVHVETHNQLLHAEILKLFRRMGWKPRFLYEGNIADETPWGRINFQGGTQSWLNPRLHDLAELRNIPTMQNSLGRRSLIAGRQIINYVAPVGSARRRAFSKLMSPLTARYRRDAEDANRRPVDWFSPQT
jgi:FkbM family methyltransferase